MIEFGLLQERPQRGRTFRSAHPTSNAYQSLNDVPQISLFESWLINSRSFFRATHQNARKCEKSPSLQEVLLDM